MRKSRRRGRRKILLRPILILLMLALAAAAVITGMDIGIRIAYPVAYSEYIVKYAHKYDLDKFLVMAVIKQESNFIPDAESDYAGGLMQLTEETAEWNAVQMGLHNYSYMDPETNIKIGCHYLSYLIGHYGNIDTALAAYNGGMGNVDAWLADSRYSSDGVTLDDIPFPETKAYVKKVNDYWRQYTEKYSQ